MTTSKQQPESQKMTRIFLTILFTVVGCLITLTACFGQALS